MAIERLGLGDLLVLVSERNAAVPMQLGALLTFEPARAPEATAVLATLGGRLESVPRLRQRLRWPRPGGGRPWWDDDPSFDLASHLSLRVLPHDVERGCREVLEALVVDRLPSDRPLWRAAVLADGQGRALAVVIVLHHVLADGVGALALLAALADPDPATAPPQAPGQRRAGRPPVTADPPRPASRGSDPPDAVPTPTRWPTLALDAWRTRAAGLRRLPAALRLLRDGARQLGLSRPRLAARTSLLARTGRRRRLDVVEVDLARLHDAARARGVSLNELVLVAVTGALRQLLELRGERPPSLVVSVPVASPRGQGQDLGNAVGVVPVEVPLSPDPAQRLAAVVRHRARLNTGQRGSSTSVLGPAFGVLARLGFFQWFIGHQRLVHTFETNLRGPAGAVTIAGGRVGRIVPMAVNPGNVTISFDVLSASGQLVVGIVSDPDHLPEHELLRRALADELEHLLTLAESPVATAR